jgi:Fur family peroxide stress response transcriptional regulator
VAFYVRCRQKGVRITPQRTAVYGVLAAATDHPSAETVLRRVRKTLPNISIDTVNRTLATLALTGEAFLIEGCGDLRRFDANLEAHQHFRCVNCKRIIDFYHKPFENIEAPAELKGRCRIFRTTVYIEGLCPKCKNKKVNRKGRI